MPEDTMSDPITLESARPEITRQPLRTQVRRILLDWLLHGELEPGSSISETELAQRLDVSRTPLREALLRLEFEGFLQAEPGKGFAVRPLEPETAEDLYQLTGTLEIEALRRSGIPETDLTEQLRELDRKRRLSESSEEGHDVERAIRLDHRWHRILVQGCGNEELLKILTLLKNRLYQYEYVFGNDPRRIGRVGLEQHRQIIDALEAEDMEEAVAVLRNHWEMGARTRSEWLRTADQLG